MHCFIAIINVVLLLAAPALAMPAISQAMAEMAGAPPVTTVAPSGAVTAAPVTGAPVTGAPVTGAPATGAPVTGGPMGVTTEAPGLMDDLQARLGKLREVHAAEGLLGVAKYLFTLDAATRAALVRADPEFFTPEQVAEIHHMTKRSAQSPKCDTCWVNFLM